VHTVRWIPLAALAFCVGCSSSAAVESAAPPSAQAQARAFGASTHRDGTGIAPRFAILTPFQGAAGPGTVPAKFRGLFVSDSGSRGVEILKDKTYKNIGAITKGLKGPIGDWLDSASNLYVANYKGSNVTEYAPGSSTPTCTYSSGLIDPVDVTTDASGNVFVADWNFGGKGGVGYVDEYKPCTNSIVQQYVVAGGVDGVALDGSGNLFVSYLDSVHVVGALAEFRAGSTTPTPLGATLGYPGGIIVDLNDTLLACDQTSGTVDVIPPPYGVVSSEFVGFSAPFHVALPKSERLLFIADVGAHDVIVVTYPRGLLKATLGTAQGLSDPVGVSHAPNAVF
jgi:hypothetical protein